MAPKVPTNPIHIVYRLLFLYFEPVVATLGGLQALFYPATLLSLQTPNAAPYYRPELSPVTVQIAGGWFLLAFHDAFLLRAFPTNITVWRLVLAGGLISDIIYISSIGLDLGSARFFNPALWTAADAGTIVSTLIPMAAKIAGALGVGMGASTAKPKGRGKKS